MSYTANIIQTVNIPSGSNVKLGYLYNWYSSNLTNFAPVGWRLPTSSDFITLNTFLGGNSVSGGKLKQTGLTYWDSPNPSSNTNNFNFRGAGNRDSSGNFSNLKLYGILNIEDAGGDNCNSIYIGYSSTDLFFGYGSSKKVGNCVRFIKTDSNDPITLTDIDGNVYRTTKIDTQVWLGDNWKCTRLNNGTSLTKVTNAGTWAGLTTEGYCSYDNDDNNV